MVAATPTGCAAPWRDIAKLRARQARRRQDFTHKLTTDLAKNHGWVAVEDLRAKGIDQVG